MEEQFETNESPDRLAAIKSLAGPIRGYMFDLLMDLRLGKADRSLLTRVLLEDGAIWERLKSEADSIVNVRRIEHDDVRALIGKIRRFALRNHLTYAEPFWGWGPEDEDPNLLFVAGSDAFLEALRAPARVRQLRLAHSPGGWDTGVARWTQLRQSAVAIFDLTVEDAVSRASACYCLGLAIGLGKYVAVAARPSSPKLFDIDLTPFPWVPEESNKLDDFVDGACYGHYTTEGQSSVAATIHYVLGRKPVDHPAVSQLQQLSDAHPLEALEAQNLLQTFLTQTGTGREALITPLWPGTYPAGQIGQCFHITPFAKEFDSAKDAVERSCGRAGVRYRRGDMPDALKVIPSIWHEIGAAQMSVVDLTGLNANVALELGLAHALGRRTLLVASSTNETEFFPEISKLQVRRYSNAADLEKLVLASLLEG